MQKKRLSIKRSLATCVTLVSTSIIVLSVVLGCGHREPAIDNNQEEVLEQEITVQKPSATIYSITPDASQIVSKQVGYDQFDENTIFKALQENGVIPTSVAVNKISLFTDKEVKTITVDFNMDLVDYLNTLSKSTEFGVTTAIANTYLDYFDGDRFIFTVNGKELRTNNKVYESYSVKFEGVENPEFGKFETEEIVNKTDELTKSAVLFESLRTNDKNIVISPIMLKLELFNIAEGSSQDNKEEIEKYLEDAKGAESNVVSFAEAESDNLSNSLIYHEGISGNVKFNEKYLKAIEKYKTSLRSVDFTKDNATKEVNDYVNKLAFGETPNMFESIDKNASIFEVSEFNFNKAWENSFLEITEDTFYNVDNSEVKVKYLNTVETMPYFETDEVKGFVKNYKDNNYSLIAFQPKQTNIDYSKLDIASIINYYNLEDKNVKVKMPVFSINDSISLQDVLRTNGINKIFTSGNAKFENMFTESQPSFLSNMMQFNKFSINEEIASDKNQQINDMAFDSDINLNQPFVYIVYDNTLEEVILIGEVNYL